MFTELIMDDVSSLGVMSNSDLFIVKEEQKQIEFQVSSRPKLEFPQLDDDHDHHQEEEQDQHGDRDDDEEEEEEEEEEEDKCDDQATAEDQVIKTPYLEEEEDKCDDQATAEDQVIKTPYLGESDKKIADNYDNDDGFRTPTSLDHKIPVVTQCPPAPRKLRPQSSTTKRKRLSPSPRRSLSLDLSSDEVESMFPEDFGRNIKSARRDTE